MPLLDDVLQHNSRFWAHLTTLNGLLTLPCSTTSTQDLCKSPQQQPCLNGHQCIFLMCSKGHYHRHSAPLSRSAAFLLYVQIASYKRHRRGLLLGIW